MYIKRKLEETILKYIEKPEIIAVVGPRQSGKTTLLKEISKRLKNSIFISFDDVSALQMFDTNPEDFIRLYVQGRDFLFIDEFQYSRQGGKVLKRIFDAHKIKIFISGSSSIDLTVNTIKYLVGRIFVFTLYPFDFAEFLSYRAPAYLKFLPAENPLFSAGSSFSIGGAEIQNNLRRFYEEYLMFGGYPRVITSETFKEKKEVLKNIYNTYFLREVKDILGLIDDYKLNKLIKALALQIGNLIDYRELSLISEFSYVSLKKYLNFLEKTFICRQLRPYFKNRRQEIVKNPKIYFFDTGLRNAVINDFRPLAERPDAGVLLENGVFAQLIKKEIEFNYWRNKQQAEVDFIVKDEGKLAAAEVKSSLRYGASSGLRAFGRQYPSIPLFCLFWQEEKWQEKGQIKTLPLHFL